MIEMRTPILSLLATLLFVLAPLQARALEETAPTDLDTLVASLEGAWVGQDNETPMGKMGFATLFEWQNDGSLHSRSSLNSETYIDLRFWKDDSGQWNLREEGGMEGLGVQAHDLIPAGPLEGRDGHRWVLAERPDFLAVDVGLAGETMVLDVFLRGEPHVAFRLDKQPEEVRAELREQMLAMAARSPEEGVSIHDVMASATATETTPAGGRETAPDPNDPIAAARSAVNASPGDANARLALARALGDAINGDPANGPLHAFEMLQSLTTAVELDPHLAEAYHWLVGYYLNAPPIAGGSVAKASEVAHQLAEFDPNGAQQLFDQIAAREGSADGSPASGDRPRGPGGDSG
jgi:hypothetical protein